MDPSNTNNPSDPATTSGFVPPADLQPTPSVDNPQDSNNPTQDINAPLTPQDSMSSVDNPSVPNLTTPPDFTTPPVVDSAPVQDNQPNFSQGGSQTDFNQISPSTNETLGALPNENSAQPQPATDWSIPSNPPASPPQVADFSSTNGSLPISSAPVAATPFPDSGNSGLTSPNPFDAQNQPVPTFTPPPQTMDNSISGVNQSPNDMTFMGGADPNTNLGGQVSQPPAWTSPDLASSQPFPTDNTTGTTANDSVPTDLSHLVGGTTDSEIPAQPNPPSAQPETMVVPSATVAAASQVVTTGNGGGFPKWILAVAGVVLLAVIGASAYFILGIGKLETPQAAVQTEQISVSRQAIPTMIPTTVPIAIPTVIPSDFGNLQGGNVSPEASATPNAGSSAMDRLRLRISPTPPLLPR